MLLPPHSISCMYDNEQRGGREGQPERGKESLFSQAVLACFMEFGWRPQSLPVHASIWGLCYVSKSIVSVLNNRKLIGREETLGKTDTSLVSMGGEVSGEEGRHGEVRDEKRG